MGRLLFSARGLVLALGLVLGFAPGWLMPLAAVDAWLFEQIAAMRPSPPEQSVVVAQVPLTGDAAWLAQAAARVDALGNARSVAMVVPAGWLAALQWTPEGRGLVDRLAARGFMLGVETESRDYWRGPYERLPKEPGPVAPYLDRVPAPTFLHPGHRVGGEAMVRLDVRIFPAGAGLPSYPLVWHAEDGPVADVAAALVAGDRRLGPWRAGQNLTVGNTVVSTGVAGNVMVPAFADDAVTRWRWDDPPPPLAESFVILAPAGVGQEVAKVVAALTAGDTAHMPYWASAAGIGLVLVLTVYAALVLPRMTLLPGVLLSLLFVTGVLAAEVTAYLREGWWLGWTPALMFLVLGHPLALLARLPQRRLERMGVERDRVLRRLGHYQVEQGDYVDAFVTLRGCRVTDEVLDLVYRSATALERRRRYAEAREMFQWLESRRPGYADVRTHLQSLEPAAKGRDASQTVVMSNDELARPLIGRYEVIRELGRGATGVVYLGRDPKIGREVAIKTLAFSQFEADELATFKDRFAREAEAAGRLSHPNIVTVYDVGEEEDLAFIAMDYVRGRTLAAYTGEPELLPVSEALGVLAQVADALAYAHGQGIVHRDIKPANTIYDADEARVKVTDFGIARVMDSSRTRTGSILGTPSYMAPEQLTGNPVDGRTDVFSLGITLYQLVTGEMPFQGENLAGIAYQITSTKHRGIRALRPELPNAVSRIVNRALQKSPDKRFQDAAEMAEALRKAAGPRRRQAGE